MIESDEWCEAAGKVVNGHDLKVLSGSDDHLVDAQDKVAANAADQKRTAVHD
jgi:hypothetical protein